MRLFNLNRPALALLWSAVLLGAGPAALAEKVPAPPADPLAVFTWAVELSRSQALTPPDEARAAAEAARGYLRTLDPYSTYVSPEERAFLEDLDQPNYSGIGMEVIAGPGGGIFCIPFEGGPAHQAGVRPGDRLLAVNGQSVADESPEILPVMVRGPAGTEVELRVSGPDGSGREVRVVRARVQRPVVEVTADGQTLKIRIYRFEPETPELVRRGLAEFDDHQKVLIDLRGNIGGDLGAAVKTAALFLPPNTLIATVIWRPGSSRERARHRSQPGDPYFPGRRVVIWQDQWTASASELFLAALTARGGAVSIGPRSTFGKALVQERFPAPDGGYYLITTGEILPPGDVSFNGEGLKPQLLIRSSDSDGDYYRRTEEAFESIANRQK